MGPPRRRTASLVLAALLAISVIFSMTSASAQTYAALVIDLTGSISGSIANAQIQLSNGTMTVVTEAHQVVLNLSGVSSTGCGMDAVCTSNSVMSASDIQFEEGYNLILQGIQVSTLNESFASGMFWLGGGVETGSVVTFGSDGVLAYTIVACSGDGVITGSSVGIDLGCSAIPSNSGSTSPTSTTINCTPSPVSVYLAITCTASVSGISSPAGEVIFTSSSNTGTFDPQDGQCTLDVGSCYVTFFDSTPGNPVITASYAGDSENAPSSAHASVTITSPVLIGVENVVSISNINVDSGDSCENLESFFYGGVNFAGTSCFSIQQNFVVIVPNEGGGVEYSSWAQDVVVIGDATNQGCSGYGAEAAINIFPVDFSSFTVSNPALALEISPLMCVNLQDSITLKSIISGGQLEMSSSSGSTSLGSFTCPLPASLECLGSSASPSSYIYAGGLTNLEAPELDIVGPGHSSTATFSSSSSGTVQSQVELQDGGWSSAISQAIDSSPGWTTGEKSGGLFWLAQPSCDASSACMVSFSDRNLGLESSGDGQGVIYLPAGYLPSLEVDALPIDGAADVSTSTAVVSITEGGSGPTCAGGDSTTLTMGQLPYFTNVQFGASVCYAFLSPIGDISGLYPYTWYSLEGTGSATGETAQVGELTMIYGSSIIASYTGGFYLIVIAESPVNLLVIDPGGRQAGFVFNGTEVDQVPDATLVGPCTSQSEVVSVTIPAAIAGNYSVEMFPSCASTSGTNYTLSIQNPAGTKAVNETAYQGAPSKVISFLLASTSTSLTCGSPVVQGTTTLCLARVSGAYGSTDGDAVVFTASGEGTFNSTKCYLASGSCSVNYTPATGSGTPQTILATFGGNVNNLPSSGTSAILVNSSGATTTSSTSPNQGIPEFPPQLDLALLITLTIVIAYVLGRSPRRPLFE